MGRGTSSEWEWSREASGRVSWVNAGNANMRAFYGRVVGMRGEGSWGCCFVNDSFIPCKTHAFLRVSRPRQIRCRPERFIHQRFWMIGFPDCAKTCVFDSWVMKQENPDWRRNEGVALADGEGSRFASLSMPAYHGGGYVANAHNGRKKRTDEGA